MADCVFCKIVAGAIPSAKVVESEQAIAFLDIGHVNPGHTLVALKRHAETLLDASEAEAAALFALANRVAKAIERAYKPGGFTILQANRKAGFQTVPHLHLHVLPRHEGDGVALTWPAKNPPRDALSETLVRVRAEL